MRKSLLKTIVATAVVGATMALSSIYVLASEATYNFTDSSLSAFEYDNKTPTNLLTEDTEDFSGKVIIHGTKDSKGVANNYKPALISYAEDNQSKGYLSEACGEGTLKNTVFTKAMVSTNAVTKDYSLLTVKGIEANDVVEVYFFGADSKGASGKACGIKLSGVFDTDVVKSIIDGTAANKDKEGFVSNKTVAFVSGIATKNGDLEIFPTSGRLSVAAVVVVRSAKAADKVTSMTSANAPAGDQYTVDTSVNASYIIHKIAQDDLTNFNLLALANSSGTAISDVESDTTTRTVYKTVKFPDGSSITAPDGYYYFAVQVNKTTVPTSVNYSWVNVPAVA